MGILNLIITFELLHTSEMMSDITILILSHELKNIRAPMPVYIQVGLIYLKTQIILQ